MRSPVGTPYDQMCVHLRFAVLEPDVANHRERFHLFIENHGRLTFFSIPVEPPELRTGKSADRLEAASSQTCSFENRRSALAIASPVSRIKAKTLGLAPICFQRMLLAISVRDRKRLTLRCP